MKYELRIKAVAIRQAAKEYAYYKAKSPALADRFIAEIQEAYAVLSATPSFEVRKHPFRYLKLRKFPHRLTYEVHENSVVVYQLRHLKRKSHPKYGP